MHVLIPSGNVIALQILEVLNAAANESGAGKSRRERADPSRRHTLVTCACAAALAGLDALARKYRGKRHRANRHQALRLHLTKSVATFEPCGTKRLMHVHLSYSIAEPHGPPHKPLQPVQLPAKYLDCKGGL